MYIIPGTKGSFYQYEALEMYQYVRLYQCKLMRGKYYSVVINLKCHVYEIKSYN